MTQDELMKKRIAQRAMKMAKQPPKVMDDLEQEDAMDAAISRGIQNASDYDEADDPKGGGGS